MALLMGNLGVYKFIALLLGVSILSHIDIWFFDKLHFFLGEGFFIFQKYRGGIFGGYHLSTGGDPNEQLRHLNLGTFFVFCFLDENSTQSY